MKFQLGALLENFRKDTKEALQIAQTLGLQGVQIYATHGKTAPENLSTAQRRELLDMVKSHGLRVSALCGDLGGGGFAFAERNPEKIERSRRILELACDLETDIVTTHVGVVPEDENHPRYGILQEACGTLAHYADGLGAHFAIETGPETAVVLKKFLDSLGSRGVSVNLDPANLVMVTADDPAEAVRTLREYIVHTHAKDGRQIFPKNPEEIYGMIQTPQIVTGPSFEEVPLGEGQVDWAEYLTALTEIGYQGFLTIEREAGEKPDQDIANAIEFLRKFL